jgi:hypothetical protein
MMDVAAGRPLIDLLTLAYRANQPVLSHGRHGVGKSKLVERAAQHLGIQFIARDLSLMEPPDLIGIPAVGEDRRTHYAAPSFLPHDGRGFLLLEELNRAPRYVREPCLQLLTARRLNDYVLPAGWLPCAAVNDAGDDYQVDELDPAMLSRFLQVRVVPDVEEWARWARGEGAVHPEVVDFVESAPGVFDDPEPNPRAWEYASNVLKAWEAEESPPDLLATALAGLVGDTWTVAFIQAHGETARPLTPQAIIDSYLVHRPAVTRWLAERRLDLISASLDSLKRHLQPQHAYDAVVTDGDRKRNVEAFFSDLPADLRKQTREWLAGRGFQGLTVARRARR